MEEGRKRVLGIMASILVARHLKTTEDLHDSRPSPRTESLVGSAVQWAEPVAVKNYRLAARRLPPGATTEGTVVFERPAFKESREQLLLEIAQAEEVDRPVLAPIAFVAPAKGTAK